MVFVCLPVHGGCPCPWQMFTIMLHVHVHVVCICPCCMSMLMYLLQCQVHVQTACPYPYPCHLSVSVGVCGGVCVCVYSCLCAHVLMLMYKYRYAGLSSIHSVWYQNEKTSDVGTGPVTDQACTVWHFLVLYQTEIMDPWMPMSALVFLMLMPSYDHLHVRTYLT